MDLSKPRLSFREGRPVGFSSLPIESFFLAGLGCWFLSISAVVLFTIVDEIVVILAFVEGGVAIFDEELWQCFDSCGELDRGFGAAGRAMLMSPGGCLVNPGDHGGAAGRADWGRDKAARKSDAIFAKLV